MGLFDSFLKSAENGGVEKSLTGALDKLETSLDTAVGRVEKLADKSAKLSDAIEKVGAQKLAQDEQAVSE